MRHLRRLGHCLAAGALAGAALLPLQLVLWPAVRLDAGQLGLAVLAWTSWAAAWLGGTAFLLVEAYCPWVARGVNRLLIDARSERRNHACFAEHRRSTQHVRVEVVGRRG